MCLSCWWALHDIKKCISSSITSVLQSWHICSSTFMFSNISVSHWYPCFNLCQTHLSKTWLDLEVRYNIFISIFINIWFAIWRLNKYILYAKGLSKGAQATQSVKWNEMYKWKMIWNTQDTNLSNYVSKANVDHTISGQGTGISTVDHVATTPRAHVYAIMMSTAWQ